MNCAEYQRLINRFIDHEVKANECAELFAHLGTCGGCRQFYDTIITLGAELDKAHLWMDEASALSWRPSRHPMPHIAGQTRIAPRPSTLVFIIVAVFLVGLLFSVNVTIEKPAPPIPVSAVSR
ncbi:MAG: hypothetical protein HW389_3591 [Bacteroidetes bacterium]|nr:hypothetical protein [Bacteroidota bacterium]